MRPLLSRPRPPSPSGAYRLRGIRQRIRAQERCCSLRRARGRQLATSPTTLRPAAPPRPRPRPPTAQRYGGGVGGPGVGWLLRRRARGVAGGPCAENRRTRGDELGMNLLRYSLERVPMNPSSNQACRPKLNFRLTAFSEVRYPQATPSNSKDTLFGRCARTHKLATLPAYTSGQRLRATSR